MELSVRMWRRRADTAYLKCTCISEALLMYCGMVERKQLQTDDSVVLGGGGGVLNV